MLKSEIKGKGRNVLTAKKEDDITLKYCSEHISLIINKENLSSLFKDFNINKIFSGGEIPISDTDTKYFSDVISMFNDGKLSADAFDEAIGGLDESMLTYLRSCKNGSATLKGYQAHLQATNGVINTTTIKTKAAAVAMGILKVAASTALTFGIGLLIQGLVTLVDKLIVTKKEFAEMVETAKENINDANDSFKNINSTVDGVKQRYAELAQGIDQLTGKNKTLSTDDYKEFLDISHQLSELFPELTHHYDENGNAILNLTGSVDGIVGKLNNLVDVQRQLANQKIADNIPVLYKDYSKNIDKLNKSLTNAKSKVSEIQDAYKILYDSPRIYSQYDGSTISQYEDALSTFGINPQSIKQEINDKGKYYYAYDNDTIAYTDNLNLKYKELLREANEDVLFYTRELQTNTSSFTQYLNNWLSNEWSFIQIDDTGLQTAITQILDLSDWMQQAVKDGVDKDNWDEVSQWIRKNYLYALDQVKDNSILNKMSELFTVELSPEQKVKIAEELKAFFDDLFGDDNVYTFDMILNVNNPQSEANLLKRFNDKKNELTQGSDIKSSELNQFFKDNSIDSNEEYEKWLSLTGAIHDATVAMDAWINANKENITYDGIVTEQDITDINEYKDKLVALYTIRHNLDSNGTLSADDLMTLNTKYKIFAEDMDGYKTKIDEALNKTIQDNNFMDILAEAIEKCDDKIEKSKLQSLYNTIKFLTEEASKSGYAFGDLSSAITTLQNHAQTLRDVKTSIDTFGYIDASYLDDILSAYPILAEEVAKYNAGLITSKELFGALTEAYAKDESNYKELNIKKLQYDEQFYDNVTTSIPQWLSDLAESYQIDFDNFKTLYEEKASLEKQFATSYAEFEKTRSETMDIISSSIYESYPFNMTSVPQAVTDAMDRLDAAKKKYEDLQKIIDGFDLVVKDSLDLQTDWDKYGNKDSKTTFEQDFDWVTVSINNLKQAVDDAQDALDNTTGFDEQITAAQKLEEELENLRDGYSSAEEYYNKKKSTDYQKLVKLVGQKQADTYMSQLMSRDTFTEEKFKATYKASTDPKTGKENLSEAEKIYNILTKIKDDLDKAQDMSEGVQDTTDKINENEKFKKTTKLNKTKEKYDFYEEQLESDLISPAKKKELLEKQNKNLLKQKDLQAEIDALCEDEVTAKKNALAYDNQIQENLKKQVDLQRSEYSDDRLEYENSNNTISNQIDIDKSLGKIVNGQYYEQMIDNSKKMQQSYIDEYNYLYDIFEELDEGDGRYNEYYQDLQNLSDSISQCEKDQIEWNKAILNLPVEHIDQLVSQLQNANDELQKNLDVYDNAIDAINYVLDKEVSELEKQNEAIAKSNSVYDGIVSAANKILDDEINSINDQIDSITESYTRLINPIQDELNALKESNDERETAIALQKAQYELERAQSQKTLKVFKEGEGWIYTVDQDAIKDAQKNYDDALYNSKVSRLEKQISDLEKERDIILNGADSLSGLNGQIKTLQKYKEAYEDLSSAYVDFVNLQQALSYDPNFITNVLNGTFDTSAIENQYIANGALQKQNEERINSINDYKELVNAIKTDAEGAYKVALAAKELGTDIQKYATGLDPELISNLATNYSTLYNNVNDNQKMIDGLSENSKAISDIISESLTCGDTYEQTYDKIIQYLKENNPELLGYLEKQDSSIRTIILANELNQNTTSKTSKATKKEIKNLTKSTGDYYSDMVVTINQSLIDFNTAMQGFMSSASTMATSVRSSIQSIGGYTSNSSFLTSLAEYSLSLGALGLLDDNTLPEHHTGMKLGYIGDSRADIDSQKLFKEACLRPLRDDEYPIVAQKGEAILTTGQQNMIMQNLYRGTRIAALPFNRINPSAQSVSFNGDIIVQGISDVNGLAHAIKTQLPNKMIQELYKNS